jgi:hypothetical protein
VHIFWQRRILDGDEGGGATPYWFPSQTSQGAIREDRLVLPIPPGTHWKDVEAVVLPGGGETCPALPAKGDTSVAPTETAKPQMVRPRKVQFGRPPAASTGEAEPVVVTVGKPKRERKPKIKNDPKHVAAARELRDRYLEQFNSGVVFGTGKYDVARSLPSPMSAAPLGLPQAA